ncbi:HNH endonuclease, partial [Bacillus sp. SS-TM]
MPSKPFKPCKSLGCNELTRDKYCAKHIAKEKETVRYYDKHIRNKSSRSFYNSKPWRVMREFVYRRDYGLCVQCRRKGIIKIGDVVDHVIPLLVDWLRRLDSKDKATLTKGLTRLSSSINENKAQVD